MAKVIEVQTNAKVQLQQLLVQAEQNRLQAEGAQYAAEASDRDSARKLAAAQPTDHTRQWITLSLIVVAFAIVIAVFSGATKDLIRSYEHAFSKEGGLAVLTGNIALDGCVVKTAGVDESILVFEGTAHVTESQDEAVENILNDKVKAGDVVIVRYEGPKGGPGMQEMLYPTSYIKSKGLGKACALLTDGRFSGGTSGLSIGHCSPEAAAGGAIGLVRDGDRIRIDIPNRTINVLVSDEELARRREEQNAKGWKPAKPRPRKVSAALKAYAKLVMSADKGAVRDLSLLDD